MTVRGVHSVCEQRRILQQRLPHHHAIHLRFLYASLHVLLARNAAIGEYGNGQMLAKMGNRLPVTAAHALLVLLACPSVDLHLTAECRDHGDELGSLSLEHQTQLQRILHLRQQTDLRREWDLDVLAIQRLGYLLDAIIVRKQIRPILSLSRDPLFSMQKRTSYLRTAQIQIHSVTVVLEAYRRLLQILWVVAAQLLLSAEKHSHLHNQRTVLRTRLEVLCKIAGVFEHNPRVVHLRVAQINTVLANKQSIRQIALLHLEVTHIKRTDHGSQHGACIPYSLERRRSRTYDLFQVSNSLFLGVHRSVKREYGSVKREYGSVEREYGWTLLS